MKKLGFLLLMIVSHFSFGQLWIEDFETETDGATSGIAAGTQGGTWSVTTLPVSGIFSKQDVPIVGNAFNINGVPGEGVWESNAIDISGTGLAQISVNLATGGFSQASDYIRAYYSVDGGPQILFGEIYGTNSFVTETTNGSAFVAGSTLTLIFRSYENTGGLGAQNAFDDISVTAVTKVYSRASTAWNLGTTWSATDFTGSSCGCTPTTGQVAVIGGGFTVDLTADATVGGVDIQNTGTLRYTTTDLDLGIEAGFLRVMSGGAINQNGQTGAQIDFNQDIGGATLQVDVGGTVTIEDITLAANASNLHYFSGGGSLTIADDILIGADGATLTNDMTTTVSIGDRIEFSAATNNSEVVNNGTLTAATLFFDDDTNFFTNNLTATFSANIAANGNGDDNNTISNNSGATLSFVNLDGNAAGATGDGGDMTVLNSGTINQSGTFLDIPNNTNALNDINNQAGATWNYSGTGHDTNLRLFANNPTNTFNYSLSGAQQIITPVAGNGYNNLTLQSVAAAAKTALGNFSVSGNYTRSGSATFANGGFTVTLNGLSAQTLSAIGGETFSGLTINNSSAASPQITLNNPLTVSGVLTMTDGNINLGGNSLTLSSTAAGALVHGLSSASGWMYGGSLIRNRPASTVITVGTAHSLFPLGSSGDWRPFFVGQTSNANTAGTMTVSHSNATTTSSVTFPESIVRRHDAFWALSSSGISAGATFDVRAGGTNFGTIEAGAPGLADLRMSTATGVVGTHGAATGGPDYRVNRTSVAFADLANSFHVASTDAVNSPLPIELISFFGEVMKNEVHLNWETASELNNDFFTVERSAGGEVFSSIGQIKGGGTTSRGDKYELIDYNPVSGTAYYRLKQTDFDGTFTYSKVIDVTYDGSTLPVIEVFPNPSTGDDLNIKISGLKNIGTLPVVMYDHLGRECRRLLMDVDENTGIATHRFANEEKLPGGTYIIKAGHTPLLTVRFFVTDK